MLLVLDLVPGSSVGPFTLGMPLSKAVKYVRDKKTEYRCVEVKYADQAPFDHDLILNFPEHGLHLRFDPSSQRLRLIEVYDISRMQLRYGRGVLGGASHAATALLVSELMGPTYPGKYDPATRVYHLQYPGLLIMFPIPPQHAEHCLSRPTEQHLEFPDNTTPVASRMCIYAGPASTAQEVGEARPPPLAKPLTLSQPVVARLGRGLTFTVGSQGVSFGDCPQDVYTALGSPSRTVQKPGGPAVGVKSQKKPLALDYFYTYVDWGVDILFDGASHRVKKFVLRTNAPGHSEFNAYSKCNFSLDLEPGAPCSEPRGSASVSGRDSVLQQRESAASPDQLGRSSLEQPPQSEASSQGLASTDAETTFASPLPSLQSTVQGVFKDMFTSPRHSPAGVTPTKEQPSEAEGSAWEKATEWSKSILDISRPFAFTEEAEPRAQSQLDHHNSSYTQSQDASLDQPFAGQRRSASKSFQEGSGIDMNEEEASDHDQRDGWDDGDSALLGLDLSKSECSVPDIESEAAEPSVVQELEAEPVASPTLARAADPIESVSLTPPNGSPKQAEAAGVEQAAPLPEVPPVAITADSHFRDIQSVLGDAGLATIHSCGFGSNPFARTQVHGYKGVAFEIMRNGYMASMTLFHV